MEPERPKLKRQDLLYADLSYKIMGLCFKVQKELGRFAKEKQYCDRLEQKFIENNYKYRREFNVSGTGNRTDFIVEDCILLEAKAKPYIVKDDYYQTQRYLKVLQLKLGVMVNFQAIYLKQHRVINYQ